MLQPHQILLYEFAELILNQRIQKRPSTLKHSHILNLWQIKGVILEPGKELRLQINFYLQRWNTKILVETWVLEVIITKELFKFTESQLKKTQRLALSESRSVASILSILPLQQLQLNKHTKIVYNIENVEIQKNFQTINLPVIECSSALPIINCIFPIAKNCSEN